MPQIGDVLMCLFVALAVLGVIALCTWNSLKMRVEWEDVSDRGIGADGGDEDAVVE